MDEGITKVGLASSITIAVVTLLLFFPMVQDSIVKPRLYDGSIMSWEDMLSPSMLMNILKTTVKTQLLQ